MTTEFLTVSDIANLLRVSRSCVYSLVRRGVLPPGFRLGGSRRWSVHELKRYLESAISGKEAGNV